MGLNVNVINWEELISALQDKIQIDISGDFNFGPTNDILNEYLPQILELIKKIAEGKLGVGTQRIKGEFLHLTGKGSESMTMTADKDILFTGISYRQSALSSLDKFELYVKIGGGSTPILQNIYAKDTVQDKKFVPPILVPTGGIIELTAYHESHVPMDIAVDFEYADLREG